MTTYLSTVYYDYLTTTYLSTTYYLSEDDYLSICCLLRLANYYLPIYYLSEDDYRSGSRNVSHQ